MAFALLNCGMNGYYLLSIPDQIAPDIQHYRQEFDQWLRDPENDHGYWRDVNEEFDSFRALEYDGFEAFPKWLNETVLKDSPEKAVCLPTLYF